MAKDPKQGSKRKKTVGNVDVTEGLPPLNVNAAGIDVGSAEHYVAVPTDRTQNRYKVSAASPPTSIGWHAG